MKILKEEWTRIDHTDYLLFAVGKLTELVTCLEGTAYYMTSLTETWREHQPLEEFN